MIFMKIKKFMYLLTAAFMTVAVSCEKLDNGDEHLGGSDTEQTPGDDTDQTPGGSDDQKPEVRAEWLELPAPGTVETAQEYKARVGSERNYTAYYDTQTWSSLWVAYPLAAGHSGDVKWKQWAYVPDLDESIQVNLVSHSYNDGYSKGHQIAKSDRDGSLDMVKQTYYVINSVPQIQDNFNGRIWANLEQAIQAEAASYGDSLYVVTGPVYKTVGGSETIKYTTAKDDTKQIPVANYFFKAVLKVKRSGGQITDAKTVGFWFEHKGYSDGNYQAYTETVDKIEELTGWDFFTNLSDELESAAETNSSWTDFQNF